MHPQNAVADGSSPVSSKTWKLVLGAVGVVYGDIGTSPLYALRESLHAAGADGLAPEEVTGIVSLLLWTLILIVTLKYVVLMLRADNRGEGGTLSLAALLLQALGRRAGLVIALGVLSAALFFGDALITPAISVLSAVEGLELVAPQLEPAVLPITVTIIVALFWVQHRGTETVSNLFGPVTLIWFLVMAGLGLRHIGDQPAILWALNPGHAVGFLASHGLGSVHVLGSVFLAVTGAEALYADMGHFGRAPIRIAWGAVVFPALALSYLGQGALVLARPETAANPFFLMAPQGALLPLVLLATVATVIASQAVITGAFSVTHQAVQLGFLPRLATVHTSEEQVGQIYMPRVNWILMVGVIVVALHFGNSASLANAYGIAVTGVMLITSILAMLLMRRVWGWSRILVALVAMPFLAIEGVFLAANLYKVAEGGYMPLILAAGLCLVMATWIRGTRIVQAKVRMTSVSLETLLRSLNRSRLAAVPGSAVFLTADPEVAPAALLHNLKHNGVLHEQNYIVTVEAATRPRVMQEQNRIAVERIDDNFVRVRLTFGYMERPNVPKALALGRKYGLKLDTMSTSYFLNRRSFRRGLHPGMPGLQHQLFVTLSKWASDATSFYGLPANRVVELGQQFVI